MIAKNSSIGNIIFSFPGPLSTILPNEVFSLREVLLIVKYTITQHKQSPFHIKLFLQYFSPNCQILMELRCGANIFSSMVLKVQYSRFRIVGSSVRIGSCQLRTSVSNRLFMCTVQGWAVKRFIWFCPVLPTFFQ